MTFRLDHILAALAVALLAAALPVEARDMDTSVRKLVILHTNDLHGHLSAWKGWDGELKGKTIGGMVQVSGLRFNYDPKRAKGQRVWHVERTDGGWDTTAEYLVVTNSMLAAGGHNYDTFKQGKKRTEHGSQYETIQRWFGDHSPVVTPPLGRIRQTPKSK